ncbi:ras-like protein family member 12 isoform X2 [Stegostoma tigrinum]|uniref:ras-like protein family member 12 isoform X2 n=1 Tax=Stegostoma tigrinum TaxID=3053191 RepID=UPI0028703B48|nr:ras-like protein family member 12 isoform X2 [Stegostoma tigrinum]
MLKVVPLLKAHSHCTAVIRFAGTRAKVVTSLQALTVKFLTKRFISEYDPNLEDTYTTEEIVDHQPVILKIMDTADQDRPLNSERYLNWAHAFIVVYSIDNRKSFEGCVHYLNVISSHAKGLPHDYPIILLGNKLDMERYRQVSKSDGLSLASKYNCLFYEVSACLDFESVQHVFHELIREVRRETERHLPVRPLFISEEKPVLGTAHPPAFAHAVKHHAPIFGTQRLSTATYKEIPTITSAKLVTVKSARAQSKRRTPTLTLLKGFKIF